MASGLYAQLIEDCRRHHQASKTYSGKLVFLHAGKIKELIAAHGCKTLLDYGCGKGWQYEMIDRKLQMPLATYWGVEVTKYDPAWPPFSAEPKGQFDIVICTHVLGSVPVLDLPWVIDRLYARTGKVLFVGERIGPIKKKVLRDPAACAIGWSAAQWVAALQRPTDKRVVLGARTKGDQVTVRYTEITP